MEKSNSQKKVKTALSQDKRLFGWTAVFELAVLFLCASPLNGFRRRVS